MRTESTINDPRDFGIGRRLRNLPAMRQVGFSANRRLLDVQQPSHDCALGEAALRAVTRPTVVDGRRVPALRFADPLRVAAFRRAIAQAPARACAGGSALGLVFLGSAVGLLYNRLYPTSLSVCKWLQHSISVGPGPVAWAVRASLRGAKQGTGELRNVGGRTGRCVAAAPGSHGLGLLFGPPRGGLRRLAYAVSRMLVSEPLGQGVGPLYRNMTVEFSRAFPIDTVSRDALGSCP